MKTTLFNLSPTRRKIQIEIPADRARQVYEQIVDQWTEHTAVPGFRRGHAPRSVIRIRYKNEIRDEFLRELAPQAVQQAIEEYHLKVVGDPDVQLETAEELLKLGDKSVLINASVNVLPEVVTYRGRELTETPTAPPVDEKPREIPITHSEAESPVLTSPTSSDGEETSSQQTHIFISYRRDDSAGHAGHMYENLSNHFGEERVFMDVDHIEPGEDFLEAIKNAVGASRVLLAVIGKHWLSSTGGATRRLDNPDDFVRVEISTALKRNIRVIPVLVQGTTMPQPQDLPEDLFKLSYRNAFEISDRRWRHDIGKLIELLEKALAGK